METLPKICFCQAIKLTIKNYFKCSGRARRSEFFISITFFYYLFIVILLGLIKITVNNSVDLIAFGFI